MAQPLRPFWSLTAFGCVPAHFGLIGGFRVAEVTARCPALSTACRHNRMKCCTCVSRKSRDHQFTPKPMSPASQALGRWSNLHWHPEGSDAPGARTTGALRCMSSLLSDGRGGPQGSQRPIFSAPISDGQVRTCTRQRARGVGSRRAASCARNWVSSSDLHRFLTSTAL
jgi:hypothetical protein